MPATPIRLAIVGKTGAGKTSFIARALELDDDNKEYIVGHGADSCKFIIRFVQSICTDTTSSL